MTNTKDKTHGETLYLSTSLRQIHTAHLHSDESGLRCHPQEKGHSIFSTVRENANSLTAPFSLLFTSPNLQSCPHSPS